MNPLLECECGTRFEVPIAPEPGLTVRCAVCGRWWVSVNDMAHGHWECLGDREDRAAWHSVKAQDGETGTM